MGGRRRGARETPIPRRLPRFPISWARRADPPSSQPDCRVSDPQTKILLDVRPLTSISCDEGSDAWTHFSGRKENLMPFARWEA